jgi:hypothetical protein
MYDVESIWESDYAEFAGKSPANYDLFEGAKREVGMPVTKAQRGMIDPFKAPASPKVRSKAAARAERGILQEAGHLTKRTGQLVVSTSKKGLKFLRRVGGRVTGATGGLARRAVTGTGRLVGRAGAAIGRNPKVAGAVILGSAAVGAGGYAYSRRNKRGNYSRYSRYPATFNGRYR